MDSQSPHPLTAKAAAAAMGPKSRRVPQELRQRTERSCDRCKSRKQKCSSVLGQDRCKHCLKYGYDCVVTKPRKQRLYGSIESHSARMSLLEGLVKGLMPEADLTSLESMQEMGQSLGIPLPDAAGRGKTGGGGGSDGRGKENEQLVHDLQGQGQYIGRASSYFFQMKLRALVSRSRQSGGTAGRMLLFGPNPADGRGGGSGGSDASCSYNVLPGTAGGYSDVPDTVDLRSIANVSSPASSHGSCMPCPTSVADLLPRHPQAERSVIIMLVRTFFDRVNVDFPVLHEATFLEQFDAWCRNPQEVDQVWVCCLLCVLMLARRLCTFPAASPLQDEQQEARWWRQAQALLSKVLFTSSLTSVQALMLAALHLHNTNSRDVCWTLTGAAVRIGFAIGLHRDDIETEGMTPLAREMRKRVWWTLYAFEQLQVSSHDRPSAIDSAKHLLAGAPRETILDMGTHNLPEYVGWSNRLVVLLGAACRALPEAAREDEGRGLLTGPLSPAAGLLRDLSRWRTTLPRHLSVDLIDAMPPSFQRPLLLLHIQYHYIAALISRYALLSRFTTVSKESSSSSNDEHNDKSKPTTTLTEPVASMSGVCIESGRLSCQLLLKLDAVDSFNAVSWLDVYYLYSSALVLVLGIICEASQKNSRPSVAAAELRQLLGRCSDLATKHLANPLVPGTMQRWLTVVGELHTMVNEFVVNRHGETTRNSMSESMVVASVLSPPPTLSSPADGSIPDEEEILQHPHYNSSHHRRQASQYSNHGRPGLRGQYNHPSHHSQQYQHSQQSLLPSLPPPDPAVPLAPHPSLSHQSADTPDFSGAAGMQLLISAGSSAQHQQNQGRILGEADTNDTASMGTSADDADTTRNGLLSGNAAATANGGALAFLSELADVSTAGAGTRGGPADFFLTNGMRTATPTVADPTTVAAAAVSAAAIDPGGYGTFQAAADAAETRFWHEMHWEGISDMLLGIEPRSWNL